MQRPTNDKAYSGLPTADDYSPESIGTAQLKAGEATQTWPEYGLEMVPVLMDGEDIGRRLIRRNGSFIADVSDDYKLLPNEELVGAANDVARELGAGPFHEFDGDWFIKLDDHVFQDTERRRVHALYAWDENQIGDSKMSYGFSVHNSIDSSLGFSVGLFSFRHACANMVTMSVNGSGLNVENERRVLNVNKRKHTGGLDVSPEALKATIKGTVQFIEDVDSTYEQWLHETVTPQEILELARQPQIATKDLPGWMQKALETLDRVSENRQENEKPFPEEEQYRIVDDFIKGNAGSKWETYNDVTYNLWHRGNAQDTTRMSKFKNLHKVFNPAPEAEVTVR